MEVGMLDVDETTALMNRLETAFRRLETEGFYPFDGACCACLQDVPKRGHHPTCYLGQALKEIEEWKARSSSLPTLTVNEMGKSAPVISAPAI
jgi:hypothetical protein